MIAEPLERGIAEDIERGRINMRMTPKERGEIFKKDYSWDVLASRSIWAFGPDENGPNILIDDTQTQQVRVLSSTFQRTFYQDKYRWIRGC